MEGKDSPLVGKKKECSIKIIRSAPGGTGAKKGREGDRQIEPDRRILQHAINPVNGCVVTILEKKPRCHRRPRKTGGGGGRGIVTTSSKLLGHSLYQCWEKELKSFEWGERTRRKKIRGAAAYAVAGRGNSGAIEKVKRGGSRLAANGRRKASAWGKNAW